MIDPATIPGVKTAREVAASQPPVPAPAPTPFVHNKVEPPPPFYSHEQLEIRRAQIRQLVNERKEDKAGLPQRMVRTDVKYHEKDIEAGLISTEEMRTLFTDLDKAESNKDKAIELARIGDVVKSRADKRAARAAEIDREERAAEQLAVSEYIKGHAMRTAETKAAYERDPAGYERAARSARDAEWEFYNKCLERGIPAPRPQSRVNLCDAHGNCSFSW